jgi:predicted ATP-grasp superfamily ATP-dependent carboligase
MIVGGDIHVISMEQSFKKSFITILLLPNVVSQNESIKIGKA